MATTHDAPTSMTTRNRGRKLPMTVISTLSGVRPQKDAAHPPKYMREGALLRKKKSQLFQVFRTLNVQYNKCLLSLFDVAENVSFNCCI